MLISFVIPVYNVEKYLNECVESVISQNFYDCEVVLVDDGSTDNSGRICDEYAEKYKFVSVIHKVNGGLSDARNAGLKIASGDYVLFLDSDDYIAEGSLSAIADSISAYSPDVVFLNAKKFYPDGKVVPLGDNYSAEKINGKSKAEVMSHLASLPKYPGSACTKAIRRQLILDNSLFFEKGLLSEDIDWTMRLFTLAEKFAFCDADYYYYRQRRAGSITNTKTIKNVQCLIYIIKKWASKDLGRIYQKEINAFVAYEYMIALLCYVNLKKEEQKLLTADFKAYKWVLKFGNTKKTKLVRLFSLFFGIRLTSKFLKVAHKYL